MLQFYIMDAFQIQKHEGFPHRIKSIEISTLWPRIFTLTCLYCVVRLNC